MDTALAFCQLRHRQRYPLLPVSSETQYETAASAMPEVTSRCAVVCAGHMQGEVTTSPQWQQDKGRALQR